MNSKIKIIGAVLGVFLLGSVALGASNTNHTAVQGVSTQVSTPTSTPIPTNTPTPTLTPTPTAYIAPTHSTTQSTQTTTTQDQGLSNNNYYTNSSGNEVHSPANSTDGSVPAGATARCVDGTYSFSQHARGTCSHHGGVAQWL